MPERLTIITIQKIQKRKKRFIMPHPMTQDEKYKMMTEAPIPPLIGKLAVPTIVSMLITSIYNMADTFFVGRIGTSATAAVGIVFPVMAVIQALGFFCGHGSWFEGYEIRTAACRDRLFRCIDTGFGGNGAGIIFSGSFGGSSWLYRDNSSVYQGLSSHYPHRSTLHDCTAGTE